MGDFNLRISSLPFLLFGFWLLMLKTETLKAEEVLVLKEEVCSIGSRAELLDESWSGLSVKEVLYGQHQWKPGGQEVYNFGHAKQAYWLRFFFRNGLNSAELFYFNINNALIDSVEVWVQYETKTGHFKTGDHWPFYERPVNHTSFSFPIYLQPAEAVAVYVRIKTADHVTVPFKIGPHDLVNDQMSDYDFVLGMYTGLMLVMFLYNLIVYYSTRDRSYLFYIAYILCLLMAQLFIDGAAFKRFFGSWPLLHHHGIVLLSTLTGFAAIAFARHFLRLKVLAPGFNKGLYVFQILYTAALAMRIFGFDRISFMLLDLAGGTVALYGLAFAIWLSIKGNRAAKFYLIAWTFFIGGLIVFVLKNLGILPHNIFTESSLRIGSAGEVILLSFALGDRINRLRREREEEERQKLEALKANQVLIEQQKTELEQRVKERTLELQEANEELRVTLENLKDTQAQLVDAEKMASLGQLTAGIAHEINNPINFVTSNISPLKRDIQDISDLMSIYRRLESEGLSSSDLVAIVEEAVSFKGQIEYDFIVEEIDILIEGIRDGANRTSEIVRGLRTFSRLDEESFKEADFSEGLDATLTLLNNRTRDRIEVVRNYEGDCKAFCLPGKVNQVFMNLLSNSIYAVNKRMQADASHLGRIEVSILSLPDKLEVRIKDNGTGMPVSVRSKIFDPFFTTKEVGEGTGLGLSIVFKIMQVHKGQIQVKSVEGDFTEFLLIFPLNPEGV